MSFLGLASKIAEVAGPLIPALRTPPQKKAADRAVNEAGKSPPRKKAEEPAPAVGEAVSTQQVVRLTAEPALVWKETEWRCPEATRLTIVYADGLERVLHYPAGTRIRVAAGMIHLPRCEN